MNPERIRRIHAQGRARDAEGELHRFIERSRRLERIVRILLDRRRRPLRKRRARRR